MNHASVRLSPSISQGLRFQSLRGQYSFLLAPGQFGKTPTIIGLFLNSPNLKSFEASVHNKWQFEVTSFYSAESSSKYFTLFALPVHYLSCIFLSLA